MFGRNEIKRFETASRVFGFAIAVAFGVMVTDAIVQPGGPAQDPTLVKCVDQGCSDGGDPTGDTRCGAGGLLFFNEKCSCVRNPAGEGPTTYCEVSLIP